MRILSYNIHKGIGGRDRLYRFERIIQVIGEENPDLICLQEVTRNGPRSPSHDQPHLLRESLQAAAFHFQMTVHYKRGGYGNLILSKWPILSVNQVSLHVNRKRPRGAQLVVVDTPEGNLRLINLHLGLAEKVRRWQAETLLLHPAFQEAKEIPTIIMGDFNDWRNNLASRLFEKHSFAQVTTPPKRFRSFPAFLPILSLDKAFFRGSISVTGAQIADNLLARQASDHLPLVVDFHLC